MEYKISRHPQTEMERRNIFLPQVESVLDSPQQILLERRKVINQNFDSDRIPSIGGDRS